MKASIKYWLKRFSERMWAYAKEIPSYALALLGSVALGLAWFTTGPLSLIFLVAAFVLWAGTFDLVAVRAEKRLLKQLITELSALDKDHVARNHVEGAYKDFG